MALIRSKNTKPEVIVRRLVHNMGFRYRLHQEALPGKPDMVFPKRKKVIFIHGCFWHRHQDGGCKNGRLPKSRLDYWLPKLERNVARDLEASERLAQLGWAKLVIWECQLKAKDLPALREEVARFLCDEIPCNQPMSRPGDAQTQGLKLRGVRQSN